jgi:hypothetical protein
MKIAKVIDQFGWAYYFLDKEQQRYSKHELVIQKYNNIDLTGLNAIYIHGPDICPEARDICLQAKKLDITVIGGHAGPTKNMPVFPYLDLAVGISPQTFDFCKEHYDCPTVFLPEGVDTEFFKPVKRQLMSTWTGGRGQWHVDNEKLPIPSLIKRNNKYVVSPVVGWAGRKHEVKRMHLLDQLNYRVEIQSQHGDKFFVEKSHDHMLRFYNHIDILVMTSLCECMPRVVLEACSCGIPVVCTDVGSIRMILDPEWIVPVNPEHTVVEEMNKKLCRLEDVGLRQIVGYDNRCRAEKTLSWKVLSPYWDQAFVAGVTRNVESINMINRHFGMAENKQPFQSTMNIVQKSQPNRPGVRSARSEVKSEIEKRPVLDLSQQITAFVISAGENPNYQACIEALSNQTVKVTVDIIKDYSPMSAAFQQMLIRCKTPYYIEVDEDMILNTDAIETMYKYVVTEEKRDPKVAMCAFRLLDIHINFAIFGIKIYRSDIFKSYPYNLKSMSCEVEQLDRIKADGYCYLSPLTIVGKHSPLWTNELIFERYLNLMEKYKEFKYEWMEELPRKLFEIFQKDPTELNLYALLGAHTSIANARKLQLGEKDFTKKRPEYKKLQTLFEHPIVMIKAP